MPKSHELGLTDNKNERSIGLKAIAFGAAGLSAVMLGGNALAAAPEADATKCAVIGGATDGPGHAAFGRLAETGALAECNEGVTRIEYSGDFWPQNGALKERDAIVPAVHDLNNWLNNSPPWQHKKVMGFSEGSMVAAKSSNETVGTNINFQMYGGPEGRTGLFNSALYNTVPLVRPIANLMGVEDTNQLAPRPGIDITRIYSKGDMFANAQPQGLDPFALISGADMMVRMGAHSIQDVRQAPMTVFRDGAGVNNVVYDDGSPFTRTGEFDPAVRNPEPAPQVPPFFPGMQPIPVGPPIQGAEVDVFLQDLGLGGLMDY